MAETSVQVTLRGKADPSLQRSIEQAKGGMQRLEQTAASATRYLKYIGVAAGAAAISVAKIGVGFNTAMENATISFGAMLAQMAPQKFSTLQAGLEASRRMVEQLRVEALLTTATFRDLVEGTQGLIGPALQAGVPVEQIPQLVAMISRTVSTVMPGAPGYQLMQEGRALLTGDINASAFVAKSLGISGADIKAAMGSGRLLDFLTDKMGKFNQASELSAKTLTGLWSNLKDALDGVAAANFEELTQKLKEFLAALTEVVNSPGFSKLLETVGDIMAGAVGAANWAIDKPGRAIGGAYSAVKSFSDETIWSLFNVMGLISDDALAAAFSEMSGRGKIWEDLNARPWKKPKGEQAKASNAATPESEDWMAFWFEESARLLAKRKDRLSAALDATIPQSSMARFGLFAGRGEQTMQQIIQLTLKSQLGELQKINRKLESGIAIEEPSV